MEDDARRVIIPILEAAEFPVVVELGAQNGDDTEWLYEATGGRGTYVALEPDPRNAELFEKRHADKQGWFREAAIASFNGKTNLYMCDNDTEQELASSSIYKPTGHLEYFPWCKFPSTKMVECITLDTLFQEYKLSHIDLIWADMQGAEADMIRAGTMALRNTRYLFMEAETTELYEDQVLRDGLLKMLPAWTLVGEFEWNVLLRNRHFDDTEAA